jgi:hypothetical protein
MINPFFMPVTHVAASVNFVEGVALLGLAVGAWTIDLMHEAE